MMVGRITLGVGSTGIIQEAGVDTCSVNTGFFVQTFSIRLASNGQTFNLRVSDRAVRTPTNGFVPGHKAFRVVATVARIHADAIDTSLVAGALIVLDAARWN